MIKITKDTRFDIFYNSIKREYFDHINLTIDEVYNFIGEWGGVMGYGNRYWKFGSEIGWYSPKNYSKVNKIKLLNYAKIANEYLNYIVTIHGEMGREPLSNLLHGKSSILEEVYKSGYIEKQEKSRKKYLTTKKSDV